MGTRIDDIEEKLKKVCKVLFGTSEAEDNGLQADYIVSKRLFKVIVSVIGILNGVVITLASISIKYAIDLLSDISRLKILMEMYIK